MSNEKYLKEFVKQVKKVCSFKTVGEVCKDIVWLKAYDYRVQMLDLKIKKEKQKDRSSDLSAYHETAEKTRKEMSKIEEQYSKEEQSRINKCKELLDQIYQKVGFCDLLGDLFGMMDLLNKGFGQFFTPYPVSLLMAKLSGVGIEKKNGLYRTLDPTCGAGGMLIASAETLSSAGFDLSETFYVGCDIDRFCVAMTYLQLCEYDLAGTVKWGDSLMNKTWEIWETPASVLLDTKLPD